MPHLHSQSDAGMHQCHGNAGLLPLRKTLVALGHTVLKRIRECLAYSVSVLGHRRNPFVGSRRFPAASHRCDLLLAVSTLSSPPIAVSPRHEGATIIRKSPLLLLAIEGLDRGYQFCGAQQQRLFFLFLSSLAVQSPDEP